MATTYAGISPLFSKLFPELLTLLNLTVATRFGSPMISTVCVAGPLKGLISLTLNSPEGGGAMMRGIFD